MYEVEEAGHTFLWLPGVDLTLWVRIVGVALVLLIVAAALGMAFA